jgi:hypothetical protein
MESADAAHPYAPGELSRVLVGREQQQDRSRGYLSRIGTYGEMGGPLLVFQGPRGVGKTSLLREAQRDAEAHGSITAWVACRRNAPFLPDLVSRVGKAIETADILPRAEKGNWKLRLESIGLEFGLPSVVKVSATAAADRSKADAPPRGAQISAMEDLLHETISQVRARGGAGLVVFVDELHAATRHDLAVLLNAMQNLAGRREDNPLATIGAGLPSTPGVLVDAATLRGAQHLPHPAPTRAGRRGPRGGRGGRGGRRAGRELDVRRAAGGRGRGPGILVPAAGPRPRDVGGGQALRNPVTCPTSTRYGPLAAGR